MESLSWVVLRWVVPTTAVGCCCLEGLFAAECEDPLVCLLVWGGQNDGVPMPDLISSHLEGFMC